MSQLVVSNLDERLETELKRERPTIVGANMVGANSSGPPERTLEVEVRQILQQFFSQPPAQPPAERAREKTGLGTRIASRLAGGEFEYEIPDLRGYPIEPMEVE